MLIVNNVGVRTNPTRNSGTHVFIPLSSHYSVQLFSCCFSYFPLINEFGLRVIDLETWETFVGQHIIKEDVLKRCKSKLVTNSNIQKESKS